MSKASQDSQTEKEKPWPTLPNPLQHRMSMKWATLESLRIIQSRQAAKGETIQVLLLTALGVIVGHLADITDSYEDAVSTSTGVDVASACAHLRTELWSMYSKQDPEIEANDCGAMIHVTNATIHSGAGTTTIHHLALFASEIVGFSLVESNLT